LLPSTFVLFRFVSGLASYADFKLLQRDHSMLSFEAQQFQGTASIIEKLAVGLFPSLFPVFSLLTLFHHTGPPLHYHPAPCLDDGRSAGSD
jgi:hypothetical protein